MWVCKKEDGNLFKLGIFSSRRECGLQMYSTSTFSKYTANGSSSLFER